jgi:putative SOS response-associated peptidase YedK
VNEKPAFRNAMRRRRCLFPADGFYEWKNDGGRRSPYFVRPKDGGPIAYAGLWESWMGPNGEETETAAIVTTTASRDIVHLHDRMPVIVPPDAFDLWLDCRNVDAVTACALFVPAPAGQLEAYQVSPAVNRADNDGPELIEPAPSDSAAALAPAKREKKRDERQGSLF